MKYCSINKNKRDSNRNDAIPQFLITHTRARIVRKYVAHDRQLIVNSLITSCNLWSSRISLSLSRSNGARARWRHEENGSKSENSELKRYYWNI